MLHTCNPSIGEAEITGPRALPISHAGQMGLVEDLSQNFKVEKWLRKALVSLQPHVHGYPHINVDTCTCVHVHTQTERERESVNRITDPMVWLPFHLSSWNKTLANSLPLFRQCKTHSCPEPLPTWHLGQSCLLLDWLDFLHLILSRSYSCQLGYQEQTLTFRNFPRHRQDY